MKRRILFLFFVLCFSQFFVDCIHDPKYFADASSVEVIFYEHEKSREGVVKFSSDKKSDIEKFSRFISADNSPQYKCGYSGKIVFTAHGGNQYEMEFNLHEDCRHFVFLLGEDLIYKKIKPCGIRFLKELSEK